jgi:Cu(I)/Ag(I) efflux system membrane fusion protein
MTLSDQTPEETRPDSSRTKDSAIPRLISSLRATARWLWLRTSAILTVAAIAGAFWIGFQSNGSTCGDSHEHGGDAGSQAAMEQVFTCSMHPQIRQDGPGLCPICNMELVPVKEGGPAVGSREVALSPAARRLAEIDTVKVARQAVDVEVLMVGKVDYDETRVRTISAWLDGRIEQVHADFTGKVVAPGDPLLDLYSPGLLVAQKELLLALSAIHSDDAGDLQQALLSAAREKLRLWGLSAAQITAIEARGEPEETLTIAAPIGGTIVSKQAQEGKYVKEGMPLLTLADLSVVWVQLDAYESDLPWLRTGQRVSLAAESLPGVVMEGSVRFIDPVVDTRTRTAKVRVEVPNADGLLKPGMFIRAKVSAPVFEANGTYHPVASVAHTCAMHPQVRTDGPGRCPICGMDLVPVAGKSSGPDHHKLPLVVPATALLRTGKRAVAYVETEREGASIYEGRTVTLGPVAGDFVVVRSGLKEGESVVTHGNFKVDAALQILAKPSMMSLPSERDDEPVPAAFQAALSPLYNAYFATWEALKNDDDTGAILGYAKLLSALSGIDSSLLSGPRRQTWQRLADIIKEAASKGQLGADIGDLRIHFEPLSKAALALERTFGHAGTQLHYEMYCPMAFDNRGAAWLQPSDQLLNPYFGASMLRCGETRETFVPASGQE